MKKSCFKGCFCSKAFTLIELLVVVLIIGILAAVAVPQYQKAVLKSRFSTVFHLVKAIHEAEEVYYLENGKYTNQIEDLIVELPEAARNSSPGGNTWLDWNNGQYRVAVQTELISGAVRDEEGNYYLQYQHGYGRRGAKFCIACDIGGKAAKAICQGLGGEYDKEISTGDTRQNCISYKL